MYLSGTFKSRSSLIFSCLIFSSKAFCPWNVSCNCWFSISLTFLDYSLVYCFYTICFFNSSACFFNNYFLSFSNFSYNYLTSFCFRITASNSDFSALACSSNILYFYFCCSCLAYCNSWLRFARIYASTLYFYLAALSLFYAARLALNASNYACRSDAFSCNSLNLWIYFYFSSLILFCSSKVSAYLAALSFKYTAIFSSSYLSFYFLCWIISVAFLLALIIYSFIFPCSYFFL